MANVPFTLEVIDEAQMPTATDEAIRRLLCECFPADAAVFSRTRAWHGSGPEYSVVHLAEDRVVGHVGVHVRQVQWGDQRVRVAGVQNVAVAPAWRGSGLSVKLMRRATDEAQRRGIPFGLLFCLPVLERFYQSAGWQTVPARATARDESGRPEPIPAKNITMAIALGERPVPAGDIDLLGADW